MRAGAEVIYQATFLRDGLRGHADFLFRVERPSELGDYSYEVADTKLARRAKPYFILQLCFYTELLRPCRASSPSDPRHPRQRRAAQLPSRRVLRLLPPRPRRLPGRARRRAARHLPEPVDHCRSAAGAPSATSGGWPTTTSAWSPTSAAASASCCEAGIDTLAALGGAERLAVEGIDPAVLERLREQAALQLAARRAASTATCCSTRAGERLRPPAEALAGRRLLRHGGRPVLRRRGPRVPVRLRHRRGRRAARSPRSGAATAPRRGARSSSSSTSSASAAALPRPPRLPLRPLRGDGAEAPRRRPRHARGGARPAAARRGLRRPLQGRARVDADLPAELLDQEGRGLLHGGARHRGHRRRRLDRHVRALARGGRRRRSSRRSPPTTATTASRL